MLKPKEKKKVLFVSYGGGHINVVLPVIQQLRSQYPKIDPILLALTTAGTIATQNNQPFLGFKDFIDKNLDREAISIGKKLVTENNSPQVKVDLEESIAYLGLSYYDLVIEHGPAKAQQMYSQNKRQAFSPTHFMQRVLERVKPELLVVTSSPRAEHAAVLAAKKLGIPSLSIEDLFGLYHIHKPAADYYCVMSKYVADNFVKRNIRAKNFFITGSPAFDKVILSRSLKDTESLQSFFPKAEKNQKALLFTDQHAYLKDGDIHIRSDKEVLDVLSKIYGVTSKNNIFLLLRPHPSQDIKLHQQFAQSQRHDKVSLATEPSMNSLLKVADALISFSSTTLFESALAYRATIQINFNSTFNDMPLHELGLAWEIRKETDFATVLNESFNDTDQLNEKIENMDNFYAQGFAKDNIALVINNLLNNKPVPASILA